VFADLGSFILRSSISSAQHHTEKRLPAQEGSALIRHEHVHPYLLEGE
jgi:hypothetical protein